VQARTLLLGDWSRSIRDPIDLLRAADAVGVPVVYLVRGDFPRLGTPLRGAGLRSQLRGRDRGRDRSLVEVEIWRYLIVVYTLPPT